MPSSITDPDETPSGSRRAVFIATDTFVSAQFQALYAPHNDAQSLRDLLVDEEVGGFSAERVLYNESKATVDERLEHLFATAEMDDLLLVYYSGHGVRDALGNLSLTLPQTREDRLVSTGVSTDAIRQMMSTSRASSIVVILDCCYSGAMQMGEGPKAGGIAFDDALHAGEGIVVLSSSNEIEPSFDGRREVDGQTGELSAFTSSIVEGIRSGAADVNNSGRITPDDLWRWVSREMARRRVNQTPQKSGTIRAEIHLARVRSRNGGHREHEDTYLGDLLGPLVAKPGYGPQVEEWLPTENLRVPIGRTYRSEGGLTERTILDLASDDYNIAIVGTARSGKSTLLQTILLSLALTHSPDEVQFVCIEGSGNLIGSLAPLPHMRAYGVADDPEAMTQALDVVRMEIARRRAILTATGLGTIEEGRTRWTELPHGSVPDLIVTVDGLHAVADESPASRMLSLVVAHGSAHGIHLLISGYSWNDVPRHLYEQIQCRIELRLRDASESLIASGLAKALPEMGRGWGMIERTRFRFARPAYRDESGGGPDAADSIVGARDLVGRFIQISNLPESSRQILHAENALLSSPDILRMLSVGVGANELEHIWRPRELANRLRVPLGVGAAGEPVELDIKEAAQGGMGPHGLVIGATGSGKSELLRTLLLGLVLTHSPSALNLVLIDFKGGATFLGLQDLPHVAAVITNLQDDLTLVDRMYDALSGEMNRRQELLKAAGNFASVRDYERAREQGAPLDPLPSLLIVCDEFSELLAQKPEFAELFVAIGRLGRSLGMHLLLASQRLEEGRLRGLDSHLSYRIGLKTFSAAESRTVLGVPDAYELPSIPGSGYLKYDTSTLVRFKAAYVSGPYREVASAGEPPDRGESFDALSSVPSVLDVVVRRLRGHGEPAHEVWLPPLGESPPFDALFPPLGVVPGRGLCPDGWAGLGTLRIPVGIVDLPYEQRRDLLVLDLSGSAGQVAVVGRPQSGKSTALRDIVTALALTHTPEEVQAYVIDLGGGSLSATEALPHVGGVATRSDPELISRVVAEVGAVLSEREEYFRRNGIESMAAYRGLRRDGQAAPGDASRFADVFLVIDGWGAFRQEFEDLEQRVTALAAHGLSFGVHVLISATRWTEIRAALKDMVGTRLELRLGDPGESEVDRGLAHAVPPAAPGRGLSPAKRHFLMALPRIDGSSDATSVSTGFADLAHRVSTAWDGPTAPPVRMLPEVLPYAELAVPAGTAGLPIGINEEALAPVLLDFNADPHFLYFADGEAGKTNFLKMLAAGLMRRHPPGDVRILLADYRRTMLGFVPQEYLAGYAAASTQLESLLVEVTPILQGRLPGRDVTAEQLQARDWWSGPELYVFVDDYDLVAAAAGNPIAALLEFLPHAKDVGLHLVVCRRTGGAARALYEPVIQRLRELGSPGFVGTGNRDEGVLLGRAKPAPWPPGRGLLVDRRGNHQLVQIALR